MLMKTYIRFQFIVSSVTHHMKILQTEGATTSVQQVKQNKKKNVADNSKMKNRREKKIKQKKIRLSQDQADFKEKKKKR